MSITRFLVVPALFLVTAMLAACATAKPIERPPVSPENDTAYRSGIVGTWESAVDGDMPLVSTDTFSEDGRFTSAIAMGAAGDDERMPIASVEGTWKVSEGVLVWTIETSDNEDAVPVGTVTRDTVLSVGADAFRLLNAEGTEQVYTRVEPKR